MKTIWFVSHSAMPPHLAMRVRTNLMAKYLKEKGYNVYVIGASTIHNTDINLIEPGDKRKYIEKEYDGVKYIHVKASNYTGNGLKRIRNMLEFPIHLYQIRNEIKDKPDIIIGNPQSVFGVIPYWVSRKLNAKYITEVRDLWPESIVVYKGFSRKNPIIWMMYRFEKWIYKKAHRIIFTMEGGRDYIVDKGWDKDIHMSKIHHINNGVDLDIFNKNKQTNIVEDEDLDNDDIFKVVYTGSIREANNVRKIVDVAEAIKNKEYKDIKFLIYGDGPDKKVLEKHCLENNIDNVSFKGHIDKNKIPYILNKSDLNIMHFRQSSLKKYGSSMNKMFEYLASGKPSISDCKFGYDLFTRYKAGLSIDNANVDELAEGVLKFYNMDEKEYNNYCENALEGAKDYDYKALANKLEEVILTLDD